MALADRFRRTPKPITAASVKVVMPEQMSRPAAEARAVSEAWEVWRCVPEVNYLTKQQAGLVGRLDWTLAVDGGEPMDTESSEAVMTAAFGKNLRDLSVEAAIHLQVAGAYTLCRTIPGDPESWKILSSPPSNHEKKLLDASDIVVEVRNEDPKDHRRNDSAVLAALDICRELILARAQSRAQSRNRTAQLGLLIYPTEGTKDPAGFEASLQDVITAPLSDERSSASVTPNIIGFPAEMIDKWKVLDLSGDADEKLAEKITGLIRQLAVAMPGPPEILLGFGDANHWCRPVGTLAYTRNGWTVPEIGEDVLTTVGWRTVRDLYVGDATGDPGIRVTVCNEHGGPHSYTIDATEGHSFYVERAGERLLTKTPTVGDRIFRGLDQSQEISDHEVYETAFAELLAWYSSDGTLTGTEEKPGQIRIAKGKNWNHLERVLTDLWGVSQDRMPQGADKSMWRREVRADGLNIAVLNRDARNEILNVVPTKGKVIPLGFVRALTVPQLDAFLTAWDLADGDARGGIAQRVPARLDSIEWAAVMLGYGVHRFTTHDKGGFDVVGDMHCLYRTRQNLRVQKVEAVTLDSAVWCPSTEAGTWLALDPKSGWTDYTGNTGWLIQEDNWLGNIEPMAAPVGRGYAEAIMQATLAAGLEVCPDPGPLLKRRPTTADALTAQAVGLVSDDWTREQLGANETDAPISDPAIGMALDLIKHDPTLLLSPGLHDIVAQIRNALDGTPIPADAIQPAERVTLPVAPSSAEPAAVAAALRLALPAPVTAAAQPVDARVLSAIDTQAYDALEDLVNDTTDRVLERLGAKVRTMARSLDLPDGMKNADLAVAFTGEIPNADVTIADTISASVSRLDRVVQRAYARVRSAGVDLHVDPDDLGSAQALYATLVNGVVALRLAGKPADAAAWQAARRLVAVAGGNSDIGAVA